MISSYLEGSIFEQVFGGQGVSISTMHILTYANRNGISVYTINQDNINNVLSKLEYSEDKKHEFRDLVNNGKVITVPKKKVNIKGWNGTGYIVLNSDDGTGAYMISGGVAGGATPTFPLDNWEAYWGGWIPSLLGSFIRMISHLSIGLAAVFQTWGLRDDIVRYRNGTIDKDQFIALIGCVHFPSVYITATGILAGTLIGGLAMVGVVAVSMAFSAALIKLREYIIKTAYFFYLFFKTKGIVSYNNRASLLNTFERG
ncbi:hypothetical protein [Sporohalobacter salinus]|uniref:hypothetical protein n=1 Tax=Sporohalobacter salinus TaxID=1494606 RepID=UPI00196027CD|nr:hypothetical protein [Sporohalobacter salinus]MBM7625048.1 hypothetical protein [Sporohalobacter salinus]